MPRKPSAELIATQDGHIDGGGASSRSMPRGRKPSAKGNAGRQGASRQVVNEESEGGQVQSVVVAVKILSAMADEARTVRVTEFAKKLGMTKARVSRHFATLCELGLVERVNDEEGFRLAWTMFRIGHAVVEQYSITEIAHPFLSTLRDNVRETTMLTLPSEHGAVAVCVFESRRNPVISFRLGSVLPYRQTASGRVLLAFATPELHDRVMAAPVDEVPGAIGGNVQVLRRRLEMVRKRFYEIEMEPGAFSINVLAVPIFDHSDAIAGAVTVIGTGRTNFDAPDRGLIATAQQCGRDVSAALGSKKWPQSFS